MSTVQIDVQVKTDKAASDVKKLGEDINKIKGGAPTKVVVDTKEAQAKVDSIKKALGELQVGSGVESAFGAAMGTMSAQASHLSDTLTGTSKSIADVGIAVGLSAANALGPWGQLVAGVAGAIGMIQNLEREQITQINQQRQLEQLQGDLGSRYNYLSQNIATTATASERLAIVNQRLAESTRTQLSLANQLAAANQAPRTKGITSAQQADRDAQALTRAAEQALPRIQSIIGANTSLGDVVNDTGAMFRRLGVAYTHTGNAATDALNRTAALAELNRRSTNETVVRLRREEQAALALQRRILRDGPVADEIRNRAAAATRARAFAESSLAQATRNATNATNEANAATQRLTTSERDAAAAAGELEAKQRRAAAAASAASAADMREARRRLMDVVFETQGDEAIRAQRDSTDARVRATQQFRNLVAAEAYQREQTSRAMQLARLEEDVQRTRRQNGENEAQRVTRIAEAQANYNRVRRESIQAQEAEAQRIRELADAEKTLQEQRQEQFRSAALAMAQQRNTEKQNAFSLAEARRQLAEASLSDDEVATRAVANANIALQNIQAQITANAERLQQARALGVAQSELNTITQEGAQLQIQLANAQAVQVRASRNQITVTSQLRDIATETGEAIGKNMMSATMAAIFAGENIGAALQKALSETMQSIATESAVKSLFELAKGIGAMATGNVASGTMHLKSAGLFAATAVVAGGIGAASAPTASPAGGAATSAATRPETPTRRDEEEGRGAPKNISISINAFQSSESAQALIVRSLREAGYNSGRSLPRR